jgi:hypothetical protein
MSSGESELTIVNTGAFQRVGSHSQVYAALERKHERNPQAKVFDLVPDDLPDCHTFVWILPYTEVATAKLWRIAAKDDGTRGLEEGACPQE